MKDKERKKRQRIRGRRGSKRGGNANVRQRHKTRTLKGAKKKCEGKQKERENQRKTRLRNQTGVVNIKGRWAKQTNHGKGEYKPERKKIGTKQEGKSNV